MNIKCPECGNDNQLGAIFCRNCGAKLDIETIRPVVKDNKVGGGFAGLAQRLVTIVILLAVVGVLLGLFLPFGLKPYAPASDEVSSAATAKYDALILRVNSGRGNAQHTFTPAELCAVANSVFLKKDSSNSGAGYQIEDILIDVTSGGELVVGVDTKLYGKVPARFELVGKPTVTEGEAGVAPVVGFEIASASMGHVSMPIDVLKAKLAEKFATLLQGDDIGRILKALKGLEVDSEGNVVFTFADAAPASGKK